MVEFRIRSKYRYWDGRLVPNRQQTIIWTNVDTDRRRVHRCHCDTDGCYLPSWTVSVCLSHMLTHWGRDKMAAVFLMAFLNAFSSIKIYYFLIKISLEFVPKGSINNIPAMIQIMAWRRPGDKPLSEPMMVSLPTHICVIRPQWVKYNGYICPGNARNHNNYGYGVDLFLPEISFALS